MNGNCTLARAPGRRAGRLVLAAGLAAAGLVSGCAPAAGPGRAETAVVRRIPSQVSCRSPAAWLKLSSLIVALSSSSARVVGTCYTGDGTRVVAVPQVEQAAVRAGYTACLGLYQNGRVLRVCIGGGKSRSLELPTVTRIELITTMSPRH